jgi:hypothetical protein
MSESSFETRCNALELYCGNLEKELKNLQQKYADLEKIYAFHLPVANVGMVAANFKPTEHTSRCTRCNRGISEQQQQQQQQQQTMRVWDGRLGQHVTKKSTICDSCQRSSVVLF